ncbi:MAG: hypothetical protein V1814_02690 [Candidatus Moraniibacteriota bacterium]
MSGWLKKVAAKCAAQKGRIATLALGHTVFHTTEQIFNYGIYIPVIGFLGVIYGGCLMTMLSFLTCYGILKFYDWSKKDWLGIEVVKDVRDFGPEWIKKLQVKSILGKILWWPFSKIIFFVLWSLKRGGAIAFFALSIYTDPFTTTVYFRKGSFNGLLKKDWFIFVASVLLGNIYWIGRTYLIILVAKFGFNYWWKIFFTN